MKWPRLASLGVVDVLAFQAAGILLLGWLSWPNGSDVDMYYRVSGEALEGKVPYRDFALEYPPLALVPLTMPRVLALGEPISSQDYHALLLCWNLILSLATALTVFWTARTLGKCADSPVSTSAEGAAVGATYAALAVIVGPVLSWRYDSFPALLTALGFFAVVRHRPGMAGVLLGLGGVAKIYPVFLLGLFAAYYLALGEWRALVRLFCASLATALVVMLPFRILAPEQWLSFLAYHRERGFEMGSSVAGLLWLGRLLGLGDASTVHNYGASHMVSPVADMLLPWTAPVLLLAVGGTILLYLERFAKERERLGRVSHETLASAAVVVLLMFIIVNKVFSPQYVLWIIPFVPFLPGRAIALTFVIAGLTTLVYPFGWQDLLNGAAGPTLALNLRNGLVVVLIFELWFARAEKPLAVAVAQLH